MSNCGLIFFVWPLVVSAPLMVCKYALGKPADNTEVVPTRPGVSAMQCIAASSKQRKLSGALLSGTLSPCLVKT